MLIGLFSFVGIANATLIPMVNTLVGELVSPDRRASAIGWTVGGMFLIYLIGMLVIGFIATIGWRITMVIVIVPVGVLTGIMCRSYIPDQKTSSENKTSLRDLFRGYKNILSNKSAIGVILGTILGFPTWYFYVVYGPSFYRQVFNLSASSISIALVFLIISGIIGSFTVGRLVQRTSEKTVLLSTTTFLGVITLIVFRIPNFWVTYFLTLIAMFSGGVLLTVSNSFALAQIPEYRGTMMSLHGVADSSASVISAGLGGTLLLLYGYGGSSIVLGVIGILSALVLYLLTSNQ